MTIDCPVCDGNGYTERCALCGLELDNCDHDHPDSTHIIEVPCADCDGTGQVEKV